jgi:hypothetical protein
VCVCVCMCVCVCVCTHMWRCVTTHHTSPCSVRDWGWSETRAAVCVISSCSFTMCSADSHRSRAGTTTTTRASHPVQHAVTLTARDMAHHTCSKVNLIRFEISNSAACMHTRSHHTAACAARACMLQYLVKVTCTERRRGPCDSHQISQCSCAAMHVHSECYLVCND